MKIRTLIILFCSSLAFLMLTNTAVLIYDGWRLNEVHHEADITRELIRHIVELDHDADDWLFHHDTGAGARWEKRFAALEEILNKDTFDDPQELATWAALQKEAPALRTVFLELLDLDDGALETATHEGGAADQYHLISQTLIGHALTLSAKVQDEANQVTARATRMGIAQDIRLSLEAVPEAAALQADPGLLRQIMDQLLDNSLKFTPAGGEVSVRCSEGSGPLPARQTFPDGDRRGALRPGEVDEGAANGHPQERYTLITVQDNGIGIAPEDQERLFSAFEQTDSSLGRSYEGAGLGLAIGKLLVEAQGGQLWVESEGRGRGSAFTFALPQRPRSGITEEGGLGG